MPSLTFLSLLNEASKLDVYDKKMLITIASYTSMDKDDQDQLNQNLVLPDDILNDILEDERADDISKVKDLFEE
jgi:hypothetical protein